MTEEREPIYEIESIAEAAGEEEVEDLYKSWKSAFKSFYEISEAYKMPVGELFFTDRLDKEDEVFMRIGVVRQTILNQPEVINAQIYRSRDGGKEEDLLIQSNLVKTEWYKGDVQYISIEAESEVPASIMPFDPRHVAQLANQILDKEKNKLNSENDN